MSNIFNVSSLVSKATEQALHADSMLVNTVDKSRSQDFTQKKYTPGQTITIEIEPQATITSGRVATLQDRLPKTVSATLGQYNGAWDVASINKEYDMDSEAGVVAFGRTIGLRLVREIERTGFQCAATYFGAAVGTAGTEPGSLRTWAEGRARIDDQLGMGKIYAAASPMAMVALTDSLKNATNPGAAISNQYVSGRIKDAAGMYFYQSNSTYRTTAGTADNTTPLVDGAPTNATNILHIDGNTAGDIVNLGTHFTVGVVGGASAVYAVDPETKQNLPYLQKFVVISTSAAADGSGDIDLTISPAMYDSTDSRQNISQLPPNDAVIVFDTQDAQQSQSNIIYTPKALSLISVPLAKDSSGGLNETFVNYDGLQVRTAIHPRDALNDTEVIRVDACWAWCAPRPEHGCIVLGA